MLDSLTETLRLANDKGMTYGQCVAKYGVVGSMAPTIKPVKGKLCECGANITHKHHNSIYCDICAAEHLSKSKAEYRNDLMSRAFMDLKKYKSRLTPQQYKILRGQIKSGDIKGARQGLDKLIK